MAVGAELDDVALDTGVALDDCAECGFAEDEFAESAASDEDDCESSADDSGDSEDEAGLDSKDVGGAKSAGPLLFSLQLAKNVAKVSNANGPVENAFFKDIYPPLIKVTSIIFPQSNF